MNMRVGVIGRTGMALAAARAVSNAGHTLSFIQTCKSEAHYDAKEEDFRDLSIEFGASFVNDPNIARSLAIWKQSCADVCISVNWPTLIGEEARSMFQHGVLNAHAGDLPRYRGNACPNWALLNFESTVGLTIHQMTSILDAGPYLYKTFLAIDETTYVGEIYDWLASAVPLAFVEALQRIHNPGFQELDPSIRPLRAFPRRPEDAQIDWSASARDVLALVRASSHPFDGAYTSLGGETIRIVRAKRFDPDFDYLAIPGQVCLRSGENPVVAAYNGMIEIEDCRSVGRDAPATKRLILASLRNRLL